VNRVSRNPSKRLELIEAAARLIATEGSAGLTLRRVADAVGASTMAIYTYFGGMPELRHAVRREGFARLAAEMAWAEESDDTVADLCLLGLAYYRNATTNPDLYRVMFMEQPLDEEEFVIGLDTFEILVAGVRRCIVGGRFSDADPEDIATQLWALGHGLVTLELVHAIDRPRAMKAFGSATLGLLIFYGDDGDAAQRSLAVASERVRRLRRSSTRSKRASAST
jgi:AcrR family transcriptional regulator